MTAHSEPTTPLAVELARRGLHGRTLARAAGVHENSVYAWAAGKAVPQLDKAELVAAVLGVPAERLFPGADAVREQRARQMPPPRTPAHRRATYVPGQHRDAARQALADAMTRQQLTPRALADVVGVDRKTVYGWLAGATLPNRDVAPAVAAAVGLSVEQLRPVLRPATPLQAAAALQGYSAQDLADAAEVSPHTAKKWLAGTRTPLISHATRLAATLHRPLDELFNVTPPAKQPSATAEPRLLTPGEILAKPATGRRDWQIEAACASPDTDPEQWWPTGEDAALEARATCAGCPVLGDCRDAYLNSPDTPDSRTAIWAGLPGSRLRVAARAAHREGHAADVTPQRAHQPGQPARAVRAHRDDATAQPAYPAPPRDADRPVRARRLSPAPVAPVHAQPALTRARPVDTGISP